MNCCETEIDIRKDFKNLVQITDQENIMLDGDTLNIDSYSFQYLNGSYDFSGYVFTIKNINGIYNGLFNVHSSFDNFTIKNLSVYVRMSEFNDESNPSSVQSIIFNTLINKNMIKLSNLKMLINDDVSFYSNTVAFVCGELINTNLIFDHANIVTKATIEAQNYGSLVGMTTVDQSISMINGGHISVEHVCITNDGCIQNLNESNVNIGGFFGIVNVEYPIQMNLLKIENSKFTNNSAIESKNSNSESQSIFGGLIANLNMEILVRDSYNVDINSLKYVDIESSEFINNGKIKLSHNGVFGGLIGHSNVNIDKIDNSVEGIIVINKSAFRNRKNLSISSLFGGLIGKVDNIFNLSHILNAYLILESTVVNDGIICVYGTTTDILFGGFIGDEHTTNTKYCVTMDNIFVICKSSFINNEEIKIYGKKSETSFLPQICAGFIISGMNIAINQHKYVTNIFNLNSVDINNNGYIKILTENSDTIMAGGIAGKTDIIIGTNSKELIIEKTINIRNCSFYNNKSFEIKVLENNTGTKKICFGGLSGTFQLTNVPNLYAKVLNLNKLLDVECFTFKNSKHLRLYADTEESINSLAIHTGGFIGEIDIDFSYNMICLIDIFTFKNSCFVNDCEVIICKSSRSYFGGFIGSIKNIKFLPLTHSNSENKKLLEICHSSFTNNGVVCAFDILDESITGGIIGNIANIEIHDKYVYDLIYLYKNMISNINTICDENIVGGFIGNVMHIFNIKCSTLDGNKQNTISIIDCSMMNDGVIMNQKLPVFDDSFCKPKKSYNHCDTTSCDTSTSSTKSVSCQPNKKTCNKIGILVGNIHSQNCSSDNMLNVSKCKIQMKEIDTTLVNNFIKYIKHIENDKFVSIGSLLLANQTDQIIFGKKNQTILNVETGNKRTVTVPLTFTDCEFVLSTGDQCIDGIKSFNDCLRLNYVQKDHLLRVDECGCIVADLNCYITKPELTAILTNYVSYFSLTNDDFIFNGLFTFMNTITTSDIIPRENDQFNLGSNENHWHNIYGNELIIINPDDNNIARLASDERLKGHIFARYIPSGPDTGDWIYYTDGYTLDNAGNYIHDQASQPGTKQGTSHMLQGTGEFRWGWGSDNVNPASTAPVNRMILGGADYSLRPATNNDISLGSTANRWKNMFGQEANIFKRVLINSGANNIANGIELRIGNVQGRIFGRFSGDGASSGDWMYQTYNYVPDDSGVVQYDNVAQKTSVFRQSSDRFVWGWSDLAGNVPSNRMTLVASGTTGILQPSVSGELDLGSSTNRWRNGFFTNDVFIDPNTPTGFGQLFVSGNSNDGINNDLSLLNIEAKGTGMTATFNMSAGLTGGPTSSNYTKIISTVKGAGGGNVSGEILFGTSSPTNGPFNYYHIFQSSSSSYTGLHIKENLFVEEIAMLTNGTTVGKYLLPYTAPPLAPTTPSVDIGSGTYRFRHFWGQNLNVTDSITADIATINKLAATILPTTTLLYDFGSNAARFRTFWGQNLNVSDSMTSNILTVNGSVSSNLIPTTNNTYNLGSTSNRWSDGYFNDTVSVVSGTKSVLINGSGVSINDSNGYGASLNIGGQTDGVATDFPLINIEARGTGVTSTFVMKSGLTGGVTSANFTRINSIVKGGGGGNASGDIYFGTYSPPHGSFGLYHTFSGDSNYKGVFVSGDLVVSGNAFKSTSSWSTSDPSKKTYVKPSLGLNFINELNPISYRFNDGKRIHQGIFSDNLYQAGEKCGINKDDNALWSCTYDENGEIIPGSQMIRYEELITPTIQAVKDLHQIVKDQELELQEKDEQIEKLESKVDNLENKVSSLESLVKSLLSQFELLNSNSSQSVVEPTVEPIVEPVVEPTVEPTVEPIVEPVVEPIVEPTVEPIVESTNEPIIESVDDNSSNNSNSSRKNKKNKRF